MARTIFLLLVLLNLMAFAWIYFSAGARDSEGREPQRLKAEMAADRIRFAPLADAADLSGAALSSSATAVSAAEAVVCRAFVGANADEAQKISRAWIAKLPDAAITLAPVVPPPLFDIVITGLATRTAAETKVSELKKLGVANAVNIRADDDKHFSLLLDSFAERKAAEDALKSLGKKNVRSVTVIERKPGPEKSAIEVRGKEAVLKKLSELAAAAKTLSPAACAAVKSVP